MPLKIEKITNQTPAALRLEITFQDGQKFAVPLGPVARHRYNYHMQHHPNDRWWLHPKPGVVALWAWNEMSWAELAPFAKPKVQSIDTSHVKAWDEKTAQIKLK